MNYIKAICKSHSDKYDCILVSTFVSLPRIGDFVEVIEKEKNDSKNKELIEQTILEADWQSLYNMTATPTLKHWHVYKYLKEQIPHLV